MPRASETGTLGWAAQVRSGLDASGRPRNGRPATGRPGGDPVPAIHPGGLGMFYEMDRAPARATPSRPVVRPQGVGMFAEMERGARTSRLGGGRMAAAAAPQDPYQLLLQQSHSAARAGIDSQLAAAMQDIAAREQAASGMLEGLPAQIQALYAAGGSGLANAAASLDQAQQASGLTSFMGAQAQMAPLTGAIELDRTARLADVPLLRQAIAGQAASERGAARERAAERQADLDARREERLLELAIRQDDLRRDEERRMQERRWRLSDARLQRAWDREDTQAAAGVEPDPMGSGLSKTEADQVRRSSAYKYAKQQVSQGRYVNGKLKKQTPEEVLARYEGNPTLYRVLAADLLGGPSLAASLLGGE